MLIEATIMGCVREIIEKRRAVIDIASKQRAKYEGWLKFELVEWLLNSGVEDIVLEAPYGEYRSDIGFRFNNKQYYLELKTCNTNYRIKGAENKHKPITKNINSIIADVEKLRKFESSGIVCFTLFPLPVDDTRYLQYIQRIEDSVGFKLIKDKHYITLNMIEYEVLISCFEV
ncbi:hypothetical protein SAMN05446037_105020 [Anaerovirgula multivorans]|uniref:Uncharacterized protein n=1 Tax=Anaerovirgula multivorans TaxID=312168 RepID=A0A239KMM5_9FIRM|nr:hypothetical protein [Anaerovirgula multivorans]SNT19401.1 hypothetical protein SAMN05446037_105020 [Anaerovirgula multivorans]